jgi:hypothetical protein
MGNSRFMTEERTRSAERQGVRGIVSSRCQIPDGANKSRTLHFDVRTARATAANLFERLGRRGGLLDTATKASAHGLEIYAAQSP